MTDMVLAGRAFNVQKKNGTSQSGKQWTSTEFSLTRVKQKKDPQSGQFVNYEETIPLSGFGDFNLVNGGIYQVGVDIRLRQSQNGGTYPNLNVAWVEPIQLPQSMNQPAPQYQNNYQPQNNYQQNNGGFENDDIPF